MKYDKININRAKLSTEEMSAAMDFDGLLNPPAPGASAEGKGMGKVIKMALYAAGAAVVVLAGLLFSNNKEKNAEELVPQVEVIVEENSNVDSVETVINPPLEGFEKEFLTATVNAETGGQVKLGESEITVPPDAFTDENGNAITGDVELNYREFNDVLDIYLSGIPMAYDSAGVNYTFESNGMFEIRGFQQDQAVLVASGKELAVKMDVAEMKSGFSEYFLNEETGVWEFRNGQRYEYEVDRYDGDKEELEGNTIPEVELVIEDEDSEFTGMLTARNTNLTNLSTPEILAYNDKIQAVEQEMSIATQPIKPKKANPEIPQIYLDVDFNDFPELKGFEEMLFEVAESDLGRFDAKWGEETWNNIAVSKGEKKGYYRMVFTKPGKRVRVQCTPVISEEDMPKALEIYDQLYEAYEGTLDSLETVKKEQELARKEAVRKAKAEARERAKEMAAQRQEMLAQAKAQREENQRIRKKTLGTVNAVQAMFSVNGFGYYNCDSAMGRISNATGILATYKTEDGDIIGQVNLVQQGRRAVLTRASGYSAQYNPKKENLFLGVTKNNKVAVCTSEELNKIDLNASSCVIKMKECENELKSKREIEEFIKSQGFEL